MPLPGLVSENSIDSIDSMIFDGSPYDDSRFVFLIIVEGLHWLAKGPNFNGDCSGWPNPASAIRASGGRSTENSKSVDTMVPTVIHSKNEYESSIEQKQDE